MKEISRCASLFGERKPCAFAAAAGAFLLFFPFRWAIVLPGEVRCEVQDRLVARERGRVVAAPGEGSRRFRKGEKMFVLDDPALRFARERIEYMLLHDRLLFEQQRAARTTIGDSLLTDRRISSDLFAAAELDRKIASGIQSAKSDGTFIPASDRISPGAPVRAGMLLGTLCSGRKIVRAYAGDQEVRFLKVGQRVDLYLKDRLSGISGKIGAVHPIPSLLRDSPALLCFGGELPVDADPDDPEDIHSLRPVYAVDVIPDGELACQYGRFVRAEVRRRGMLAAKIGSFIVSALRREFF